ncbi:DNA helicase, partial [Vibrio parahaemolyticus]
RAIAQREELAILSATQTNREGHKSVTAKAEHAAEDFNKIRTADLVISINATEEEMAKGEARLFFAASRNQKGEFTMRIKRDLSR